MGRPKLFPFAVSRFVRIVPGLIMALMVARFIAAQCGGFHANPVPDIVDGPVFTLTWDVLMQQCRFLA